MLGEYKIVCLVVFCALLMILEIQQNVKDVQIVLGSSMSRHSAILILVWPF